MNLTIKLATLYLTQMLSLGTLKDGFTQGGKKAIKSIGIIIILLYCAGVFGSMYIAIAELYYSSLASAGMSGMYPLLQGFAVMLITFIFGFLTTLGTYTSAQKEEILLSLPLKDKQLFLSKYIASYVCELPITFLLVMIGAVIYGKNEGLLTNPLLYISILITSVSLPLVVLAVCYILVVLILNIFSFLKNKAILIGISTVCLLVALLYLNFSYQSLMISAATQHLPEETLHTITEKISSSGQILLPVKWFGEGFSSIQSAPGKALLNILLLAVSGVIVSFLLLPLFSPLYRKTVTGFNESSAKRLSKDKIDSFIKGDIKSTPVLKTLFVRDFRSLVREPTWLTNGPLLILIMPLIIGIAIYISFKSNSSEQLTSTFDISRQMILDYIAQGAAARNTFLYITAGIAILCAVFTGCNTFVAASAISREGKGLSNLMALPVSWNKILTAKMLHAMLYSAFTTVLSTTVTAIALAVFHVKLTLKEALLMYFSIVGLSLVLNFILQIFAMLIDAANPKLDWDTPAAAMKRNMNTMTSMLMTMGILSLLIAAGVFLLPMRTESLAILTLLCFGLAIPLWKWFLKHAKKVLFRRF
ncbi:MAG: ABC transporter permease subunit [Treponemataceae bacterium]|nr:ABC transporter permease subunit [Treponemataceae bacterium]